MPIEAWFTLGVTLAIFAALVKNLTSPDVIFLVAVCLLAAAGIITPAEALGGFANPSMLTVGFLFVVAAALQETGVLNLVRTHVLGAARTEAQAFWQLSKFVPITSAFLNNTPVVAMLVPVVMDWCRHHQVSPSRLLIPVSFLAILGGTCTLIGTSTNLVVNGLMLQSGLQGMHLFEIAWVGVPYAVIGMIYLRVMGPVLLPERKELLEQLSESRREYLVEVFVTLECKHVGRTVEEAGLRNLPGLFLIEIDRNGSIIAPVSPDDRLAVGDRLIFTGIVSSIVELEKIPGLIPAADPAYEVSASGQRRRQLCEAVISESSPLIGKTIRDADFRASYGAAVVAVHRSGARLTNKVGNVELRPGDTLLLQTRPHFLRAHRNDPAFYLVSGVEEWRPPRTDRMRVAILLFLGLLFLLVGEWMSTAVSAATIAALMIVTGCISPGDARSSVDLQVLTTIALSFGVGLALENSGAAAAIAGQLLDLTNQLFHGGGLWRLLAVLAMIYVVGSILTELITNNAAAVLLFPICLETSKILQVDSRPLLMALVLAASASFMTPIGYQTNLIVYGPGGYRFGDFLRIGVPLKLLLGVLTIALIPFVWPF